MLTPGLAYENTSSLHRSIPPGEPILVSNHKYSERFITIIRHYEVMYQYFNISGHSLFLRGSKCMKILKVVIY